MLRRLHKLQYEIRKPIPKGPKRVSNSELVTCLHNYTLLQYEIRKPITKGPKIVSKENDSFCLSHGRQKSGGSCNANVETESRLDLPGYNAPMSAVILWEPLAQSQVEEVLKWLF